jgi:Protein of unknown function (DUF2380)
LQDDAIAPACCGPASGARRGPGGRRGPGAPSGVRLRTGRHQSEQRNPGRRTRRSGAPGHDRGRAARAAGGIGRFELVDTRAAQLEASRQLWNCKGCEIAIADRLGADLALVGWVQKVSNLILNINVAIREVPSRELVFAGSVDIRGNTDESWQRGIRYLLKNRLLKEPDR